jgi:peroxiredoxin Q/BCP
MPKRVSFLLDRTGKIAEVWPGVDPGVHAEQVLTAAAKL